MFGLTRWNAPEDIFNFQREVDRLFNQFWSDLPSRTATSSPGSFHVTSTDDGWRIDVPLPGVDPKDVQLEAAGNTLTIRVEQPDGDKKNDRNVMRYEQSFTVPQFLDIEKLSATHRHGMLQLSLPLRESVKPRRIEIQSGTTDERKQLVGA